MGDEITIEVRETGISIQSAGIGDNPDAAREVLQAALDALDSDRNKQAYTNEVIIEKPA